MVNNTIERFQKENLLSKKTAEGLKIFNPKKPKFFYLTKDAQRKQSRKTCYKFHQLSHF